MHGAPRCDAPAEAWGRCTSGQGEHLMAQIDVFNLVDDISGLRSDGASLDDATARAAYYADVVFEHGLVRESAVNAAFVPVVAGTAEYTQPAAAIKPLAILYDATQLRPT